MKTIGLLLGIVMSLSALAQKKQIVFVCEHGSAKSVIAATYFNKVAKERNLNWEAVARGTSPDATISPRTKALLEKDNLFDPKFTPEKISQIDINQSQQVVLFFPLPGSISADNKTRDWTKVQAVNEDFPRLRDDIVSKIKPLLDSLSKTKR